MNREGTSWGPRRMVTIGPYCFSRYRREHINGRRRWECSAHGRGAGPCRTPFGAFIALRRWMKEPVTPL